MDAVSPIAIGMADVFRLHGMSADGAVAFRMRLRRNQALAFTASQPLAGPPWAPDDARDGALAGFGSSRGWRSVGLIAPIHVKPFVKRQNEAADAEAVGLCGVAADHEVRGAQGRGASPSARWFCAPATCPVQQRTQTIDALCHRHASGEVPQARLRRGATGTPPARCARIWPGTGPSRRPGPRTRSAWRPSSTMGPPRCPSSSGTSPACISRRSPSRRRASRASGRLRDLARGSRDLARLQSMPGVGPITAAATLSFAPELRGFGSQTGLLGLAGPRGTSAPDRGQAAAGPRLEDGRAATSGGLLIDGAMSVVRWAARRGAAGGSWLARMLARKPKLLVAIALARQMIAGALDAGLPARWVLADALRGSDLGLRRRLEERGQPHVLAPHVLAPHVLAPMSSPPMPSPRARAEARAGARARARACPSSRAGPRS